MDVAPDPRRSGCGHHCLGPREPSTMVPFVDNPLGCTTASHPGNRLRYRCGSARHGFAPRPPHRGGSARATGFDARLTVSYDFYRQNPTPGDGNEHGGNMVSIPKGCDPTNTAFRSDLASVSIPPQLPCAMSIESPAPDPSFVCKPPSGFWSLKGAHRRRVPKCFPTWRSVR